MPKIRDVLDGKEGDVVTVRPDQTVFEAIEVLVGRRIGALLVAAEGGSPEGIITERDVLRIVHDHGDRLKSAPVSEFMSTELVCGAPDDELDYVMNVMTKGRFRRMPVMDGDRLAGIVTMGDIVKTLKSARDYEVRMLRDFISGGPSA